MKKILLLIPVFILSISCASQKLIRVDNPSGIAGPPEISSVIDLGSLPPVHGGEIDQEMQDECFTPGEWAAVTGDNLASTDTCVYVSGTEVPVAGYLEGGSILIRIPRGLETNIKQTLSVKTSLGTAEYPITITGYLIVNDPFSGKLIFYRSLLEEEQLFEEDETTEVPVNDNLCQAISPSGGLLYTVTAEGSFTQEYHLKTIHLGAKDNPSEISSVIFQPDSKPVSIDISSNEEILAVLSEMHLYIFKITNPALPVLAGSISLPLQGEIIGSGYKSIVLMDNGKYAAALEPSGNSIALIDLSLQSNPRVVQMLEASHDDLPLSIDIAADRDDPGALWLLQGPNIRYAYKAIQALLSSDDKDENSKDKTGLMQSRITRLTLKNNLLQVSKKNQLPEGFIPLYMKSVSGKKALISGISAEFLRFTPPSFSIESIKSLLGWMKDSVNPGRILSASEGGEITEVTQGLCIFLCIDRIAKDGPMVYSVMKLGPRYIPPSVGVDMGIEVFDNQYFYFKKMNIESLYPPYKTPLVIVQ